jgi:polysaccharide export outer membrane protein
LNISEGDKSSGHNFHIEKDADNQAFKVVPGEKQPPNAEVEVIQVTPEVIGQERELELQANQEGALTPINPAVVPPEYLIGPGDVVSVVVWDHPELNNPVGITQDPASLGRLVSADGTFFFPYVGVIKASGKTTAELRSTIAQGLTKVVASPQVDVRVITFRANRIQVFGEVVSPGVVNLDDTPKGVMEAISERGGLSPFASRRKVYLFRGGQTFRIDLAGLLSGSLPGFNPGLKAGDILQVPDKSGDQVFVLGEVEKQSPVIMQQDRMTLIEALTNAGGPDKVTSDDAGVLVFRHPLAIDQRPRVFVLDLSNPTGMLLAGEFELQPRDVVYIKKTNFAKYNTLLSQIAPTITAIYQLNYIDYLRKH